MNTKQVVLKIKRTKRDVPKTVMYSFRVTPEQDELINYHFGNSTNVRDFLLDSIEVLKELERQGKSNEYANPAK